MSATMSTARGTSGTSGTPGARRTGESFPRLSARTRRFSLGEPRTLSVAPDGSRVVFLRSRGPADPVTCLWTFDVEAAEERLVVDPAALLADPGDLPEAEARRRERARETAGGIVAYALDAAGASACFALGGQLFVVDLRVGATAGAAAGGTGGDCRALDAAGAVFDPRLAPDGGAVAYVAERELRRVGLPGGRGRADRLVAGEDDPDISWGSAEFVAAEEMGRSRGFWWSPDGRRLAVARVDTSPVDTWWVADAANPGQAPVAMRYPAAGTPNADVTLHLLDPAGRAAAREVAWDRGAFPYLAGVDWSSGRPLTLTVQSRDQRRLLVLEADPAGGGTTERWRQEDPQWVELTPGAPRWWGQRLVVLVDRDGARRVVVDGEPLTPPTLQVRGVVGELEGDLVVAASEDPAETHLHRLAPDGARHRLTASAGVHGGAVGGDVLVTASTSMTWGGTRHTVWRRGEAVGQLTSLAARPGLTPKARFWVLGERRLQAVVLTPRPSAGGTRGNDAPDGPLPVLVDPYGGPHAQRVVRARNAHLTSQWFADQGFVVVVVDGRGTPARGPAWERAVWGDLAGPVLDDQVDALEALAGRDERLDLTRVGIRGWSFGGYLAALAVLRRPDVFHAAVAGAPVTDWRLYDTHYTERYLGDPAEHPGHYERTSLLHDAERLTRPLLLVHGLADDNVVSAHTFQLSSALLAAGRPHQVLPLSGVTHMTPQEVVAENLLRLQVDFLRSALG